MTQWLQLVGGGLLLYFGAEWFVGGASALAVSLRVPQLVIGLTVVAYGTSAPEVIVGIQAALAGHGAVALGNVIGSNIANIGLILGIAALIKPAKAHGALRRRELPVLLSSTLRVPLVLLDGGIATWEAVLLVIGAAAYTIWMIRVSRVSSEATKASVALEATAEAADAAGAPKVRGGGKALAIAFVGLLVLLIGANQFVTGAVSLARTLGMSERLVGLTIVAVGTSLPELVTSVVAALKGHSDLAIGNVIGSNIFNALLCLGSAALVGSVGAPFASLAVDLAFLGVTTALVAIFIRRERIISRAEGMLALAVYCVYLGISLVRG